MFGLIPLFFNLPVATEEEAVGEHQRGKLSILGITCPTCQIEALSQLGQLDVSHP